jgi:CBS domain-containing protein
MLVRELMSTDVVTVDAAATVADAIERLFEADVGSVVVMRDGTPAGILTARDALAALYRADAAPSAVSVTAPAHAPAVTTSPTRTAGGVARLMADRGVKKVLVLEEMDVVGVVTLTDIVGHLSEIRGGSEESEEAARRFSGG